MPEKSLEIPLDSKEIKPVDPKGNQPWMFIGRTDAEAEAPILRLPDAKSQLTVKDPDAGKDWGQEEKRATEDEMVGWHHWLSGHEFDWTLGASEGQGSLGCRSPWGHKESDTTEWLNRNTQFHRVRLWDWLCSVVLAQILSGGQGAGLGPSNLLPCWLVSKSWWLEKASVPLRCPSTWAA